MEWLGDHAAVLWFAVALLCATVEVVSLDLVFAMLAGGAVVAGVAGLAGAPVLVQVLLGLAGTAAGLGVVRPVAMRHLRTPLDARTGVAALIGREAIVTARIDARGEGRIKLAGETWSARAFVTGTEIEAGESVDVVEIDGATAVVLRGGDLS
ncbi:MAG: NfeD family protein [Actinomycetales bacterium]